MSRICEIICFLCFICCLLFPLFSFADSDGNFCIGQGYVAVESRGIHIAAEKPTVYFVSVGLAGLSERIAVRVPDGDRNRSLRCEPKKIVVSNGYLIDLLSTENPRVIKRKVTSEETFSNEYIPYIDTSKLLSIPSDDPNHQYWLVLSSVEQVVSHDGGASIFNHFSARVVQTNKQYGYFMDSRMLADGIVLETVD